MVEVMDPQQQAQVVVAAAIPMCGAPGGTNSSATSLSAGTYSVTIKDANDASCSIVRSVTLTEPSAVSASTTSYML
jgi:hypothetical protein